MSINDIKTGMIIEYNNAPHKVLEAKHSHIGRGGSNLDIKLKNLLNGANVQTTFKPADNLEEVEIEKEKVKFIYTHRGEYWFSAISRGLTQAPNSRAKLATGQARRGTTQKEERFSLPEEKLSDVKNFLKPNSEITALLYNEKIISLELPIKMDFKVTEAPPAVKGDTKQGGAKVVTIETGAKISAPLFIEQGDIIRVNTETGQYSERVSKA